MRIGVNLMLWTGCYTRKHVKLIDKVGKMGFDGVEFPVFDPKAVDVATTRRALEGNGLGSTVCTVIVSGGAGCTVRENDGASSGTCIPR